MAKKIFISYSRHDDQEVAFLVGSLRQYGYEVWLDRTNLKLGQEWWDGILRAIHESDVVIFVVSGPWIGSVACKSEWEYALEAKKGGKGDVLVVLTATTEMKQLPFDLLKFQATKIADIPGITAAIDTAEPAQPPPPAPEAEPIPLDWEIVEAAVRANEKLNVDIQSSVAAFLAGKARLPHPKERRRARRLAGEFYQRPDLAPSIRITGDPARLGWTALFPVLGAILGGLALTHLFWVTGFYAYLDGVLDWFVGSVRGTARGVLAVNFVLGAVGVALCGIAVGRNVRSGKVALALCTLAIVGVALDSLLKVKWPIAW